MIRKQMADVWRRYPDATLTALSNGMHRVTIPRLALPTPDQAPAFARYSKDATALHVMLPLGFPLVKPELFWTDADLRCEHGGYPYCTDPFLRWYWEPENTLRWWIRPLTWNGYRDAIYNYLMFAKAHLWEPARLARARD
jgi:hypothetical protein